MNTQAHNLSICKTLQIYHPAEKKPLSNSESVLAEREKKAVMWINGLMMIVYYLHYTSV